MTSLGNLSYLQKRDPPDGLTLAGSQAEQMALSPSQTLGRVAAVAVVRDAHPVRCRWDGTDHRRLLFVCVLTLVGHAGFGFHLLHRRISPPHRYAPVAESHDALEAGQ